MAGHEDAEEPPAQPRHRTDARCADGNAPAGMDSQSTGTDHDCRQRTGAGYGGSTRRTARLRPTLSFSRRCGAGRRSSRRDAATGSHAQAAAVCQRPAARLLDSQPAGAAVGGLHRPHRDGGGGHLPAASGPSGRQMYEPESLDEEFTASLKADCEEVIELRDGYGKKKLSIAAIRRKFRRVEKSLSRKYRLWVRLAIRAMEECDWAFTKETRSEEHT